MVRGFYGDDIGAEVRPEEEAERLDHVRPLGLPARQAELRELLVWLQHDQLWTKDDPGLLLFVVVDLNGCVVGNSERHLLSLVALPGGRRAS